MQRHWQIALTALALVAGQPTMVSAASAVQTASVQPVGNAARANGAPQPNLPAKTESRWRDPLSWAVIAAGYLAFAGLVRRRSNQVSD